MTDVAGTTDVAADTTAEAHLMRMVSSFPVATRCWTTRAMGETVARADADADGPQSVRVVSLLDWRMM